jgi:pimeloyl-ACP methyl ester carboxylesterase
MKIIESDFLVTGCRCAGRLYLPDKAERPPVVIMAHGFGAEMCFRLPLFAERFVEAGMAVFLFDYRNFGLSDGQPRNLVAPRRHLRDWKEALAHVRTLDAVDTDRIALWGSSFSGGHVLVTAARDRNVSAVVSQVPFVDGIASILLMSPGYVIAAFWHGFRDLLRILTFRKRHTVPITADPDQFAILNTAESKPGYLALVPEDTNWKNECPARIFLSIPLYRPIRYAGKVSCPVLMIYGVRDSLIPASAVEKTIRKIKDVKPFEFDAGHFEPYQGELFERVMKEETSFLVEHLF